MYKKMTIYSWVLLGILIISGIIRAWGANHEIHSDENKVITPSVIMAKGDQKPLLYPNGSHYPHLYHYVLSTVFLPVTFFNPEYPSSTTAVDTYTLIARVCSALIGVVVVGLTYVTGKQFGSKRLALLAALFMATLPLHVKYSHYTHVELPLTLASLTTLWAAMKIVRTGNPKWYFITAILVGANGAIAYTGFVIGIVLVIAHVLHILQEKTYKLSQIFSRTFILSLLIIPISFFIMSPYTILKGEKSLEIYKTLSKRGESGDLGYTRPNYLWPIYNDSKDWGLTFTGASLTQEFGIALLLTSLVSTGIAIWRRNWNVVGMLSITSVIMYVVLVGHLPLFAIKRLLPLAPFISLLAAWGLDVLWQYGKGSKVAIVAIALAITIPSFWDSIAFSSAYAKGSTHSQAVAWVEENAPHNSVILQHTPLRLIPWDDPRFKPIRRDEVYANFNKDDPEVSHDRAKPISWWVNEKNVDYVVIDSRIVDRYYDTTSKKLFPATTASYREHYDDIRTRGKQVFSISPQPFKIAGPKVEIYDVRALGN